MPSSLKARALILATVIAGFATLALAVGKSLGMPLAILALLGAAVVVTELIQISGDENSLDPADAHWFSFSTGVHLGAVLIVGPWAAALVAAFGVLVVDGLRGSPPKRLAYNASVFALSALLGGFAFELLGGTPGTLNLPGDFVPILALVVSYSAVNTSLVSSIIAFSSSSSFLPIFRDSLRAELSAAAAEAGLGVALAFFALTDPWYIVVLIPLVFAVYQGHARLTILRRETDRALETFANVVDERDPHTYRHSARVAEYVRALAQQLGLPSAEVGRLRRAGRLHDLGKIAVDAGLLRKPGKLDGDEWVAMRRHPRVSARLLRRFRFAGEEARAVEYHHERFDGHGYYGIDTFQIPLAAHFLIVADSYDAMTSDRPYRPGFPAERALAEIEANIGSQFHPGVAKAFVALQRGESPLEALSPAERAELRGLSLRPARRGTVLGPHLLSPELLAIGGVISALVALGLRHPVLAGAGVVLAAAGIGRGQLESRRGRRLTASLRAALGRHARRQTLLDDVADRVATSVELVWAGLVSWSGNDAVGSLDTEWSRGAGGPSPAALTSWLVREVETDGDCLLASGGELGSVGLFSAFPLRSHGEIGAYLVLASGKSLPPHVHTAVGACRDELAEEMVEPAHTVAPPARLPLAAVS